MPLIFITGPTGSGKTDLADELAFGKNQLDIVNCDTGQMYEHLSIGTAKPDWKLGRERYHLFDILNQPKNLTAVEYRQKAKELIKDLSKINKTPIFVGGSLFYLKGLLFELSKGEELRTDLFEKIKNLDVNKFSSGEAYSMLCEIDPSRAKSINQNDVYRIKRALEIAKKKILPSSVNEIFSPIDFPVLGIYINPKKDILASKISSRLDEMLRDGRWQKEVENISNCEQGSSWRSFMKKYLIGYDQINDFIKCKIDIEQARELAKAEILRKTLKYAKSQRTFWNKLKSDLNRVVCQKGIKLLEINSKDQVDLVKKFLNLQ